MRFLRWLRHNSDGLHQYGQGFFGGVYCAAGYPFNDWAKLSVYVVVACVWATMHMAIQFVPEPDRGSDHA
jgi:hypothetical protein